MKYPDPPDTGPGAGFYVAVVFVAVLALTIAGAAWTLGAAAGARHGLALCYSETSQ